MIVTNQRQLRKAFKQAHNLKNSKYWGAEPAHELMKDIKDAIRNYYRSYDYSKRYLSDGSYVRAELVKSYGIDGYVERIRLTPRSFERLHEIVNDLWIEPHYSDFDCTGHPFSNWIKCVVGTNAIIIYHSVSYDI